ncbi:hypothetical protein [Variovorax sp.]|uniref:hypothetical protein n=1 Tax=Variovorax sp. TaxID=1871043 RepID=UPI002D4D780D|nr:hypothetical protein [Variovorax sp.]HYP84396.1 hypothetical protein [Variovorax sp.]
MAFQVGSACYSDAQGAAAAIASAQVGTVVAHGGAAYVVDASAVSGTSITYTLTPVSGGTAITLAAPVSVQPCGLLDWQDGMVLGWGVAGVWLAVAAVMVIRRGVHE